MITKEEFNKRFDITTIIEKKVRVKTATSNDVYDKAVEIINKQGVESQLNEMEKEDIMEIKLSENEDNDTTLIIAVSKKV